MPSYVFTPLPFLTRHGQILGGWGILSVFLWCGGWEVGVTKITGRISISISKPNGVGVFRSASAPKKDKKTNLKQTDKDHPVKIRRLERLGGLFGTRYVFKPVLRVALHGQTLMGRVFAPDDTNRAVSVTKISGAAK